MAISNEDQTKLLKVVVGLFNAAPGGTFLPDMETFITDGGTHLDLAKGLATSTTYTDSLGTASTSAEIAAVLAGNFGLDATSDAGAAAIAFFTEGLDNNVNAGELIHAAVEFLSQDGLASEFAETATLMTNKAAVAAAYSAAKGSADIAVLQAALAGVTGTALLTQEEIDALVDAAGGDPIETATFALTAAADSHSEGSALVYTVTASAAVVADTDVVFSVSVGDSEAANQGTGNTNLNDFASGSLNPVTVTIPAGQTTATFSVTGVADTLTELPENYDVSAVVNGETLTKTTSLLDGEEGGGSTFTLTAATDNIVGTSGNDTIIGDLTGTPTINASDQINGGAGTDTYKVFGAFTAGTSATGVFSSVETLHVANVAAAAQNFSTITQATQGVDRIEIGNASLLSGHTITTTTGQTLSLSTGPANGATAGTVTWAGPATAASLNIDFNGYQGGAGVTPAAFTATGALATTLNIKSMGASNATGTFTGPVSTLSHVITGDQKFTYTLAAADAAALNSISGSAATGGVIVNTAAGTTKAGFTFTGGSGDDSITVANNNMGVLTAGSQLDGGAGTADKIGIFDTALTAAELTAINAVQNFEVLGLNANLTLDGSSLTSVDSFAIDTAALTNVISNMATGANVALNASSTAQTYSGAVGVNDLSVDIGSGTNAAITSTALTVGQTTVALSSNGVTGTTNVITTLNNADNSVYTITGSAGLTITNATAATSTGTKFDGSAMTGALTMVGNATAFSAGSGLGDIIIGGSAADNLTSSVNGATMTGNAGADIFNVSAALGGTSATAMLPVVTDFTKGDTLTFSAFTGTGVFTAAKLDVSGAANLAAALDLAAAGDGSTNATLKWFNFGTDTYAVQDKTAGATFLATDQAVKLTGTLDLSTSTFTEAANTLLFA